MLFEFTQTLVKDLQQALEQNSERGIPRDKLRRLVQSAVERCNLVSREEFDVQTAVLAKTRQQVHNLEAQLEKLQADLKDRPE